MRARSSSAVSTPLPTRSPASCRRRSRARRIDLGGDGPLGGGERLVLGGCFDVGHDPSALLGAAAAEIVAVTGGVPSLFRGYALTALRTISPARPPRRQRCPRVCA